MPQVTLYSAEDACTVLAKDCQAVYGKRPVLLLSDPDTDPVAGQKLREQLQLCQVSLEHYLLERNSVATITW